MRKTRLIDLTGKSFGYLRVVGRGPTEFKNPGTVIYWECECACGSRKSICSGSLRRGMTRSCGCLLSRSTRERAYVHGFAHSSEYRIWRGLRQRCLNPKSTGYKNWGGRGIKVCAQWEKSFLQFYTDMGPRPGPDFSIDRINNDGDYCPENCRWATRAQQNSNKRFIKRSA